MNRGRYILRYALAILIWSLFIFYNYRISRHTVLPLSETLMLPGFVFAYGAILMALTYLWLALTARRRDEIFDLKATVGIRSSRLALGARTLQFGAVVASSIWALQGRVRYDVVGGTTEVKCIFLGLGVWGLLSLPMAWRNRIEISPAGISHSLVRPSLIPWADVAEVKLKRWMLNRFVLLQLRDGADYRMATLLWRWRKVPRVGLSPLLFGMDAETLQEAVDMRRAVRAF